MLAKIKKWMECSVCGALVLSDDVRCCVCRSPLQGKMREPTDLIQTPRPHRAA